MTGKQSVWFIASLLALQAGLFWIGYSTGNYKGRSKGYKEGLDTVCSPTPVLGKTPPEKEDPAWVQTAHQFDNDFTFKLEGVSFDTRGYCRTALFSVSRTKLGESLASMSIKYPKNECLKMPEHIGSYYEVKVRALDDPSAATTTPSASASP